MKIVIFTYVYKGGGAEKRASVYANYFFEEGHNVTLVSAFQPENEYYLHPDIPRTNLASSFEEYQKMSKIARLRRYRQILRDVKPEVIFSFMPAFAAYSIMATKFNKRAGKIKNIYCVALYQRKYGIITRIVDALVCLFSNKISLQCKEQIKCNLLFKRKCIVNYNPIEDKWKKQIDREYEQLNIMAVGRLAKQKNFSLAINGVAKAHNINKNISLDIFGTGPQKDQLLSLISSLGANEYIKIHDFSPNIVDEYSDHNVFILSSRFEGFPNALAEAMMAGLVCISTKCPSGPKEMIIDGKNGFFFKNANDLSQIIASLIRNSKCKEISFEARETALNEFERNKVLPKVLSSIK